MNDPPAEIHIVNGLHPGLPFSYYEELLAGFKRIKPDIHMKCFTAVEIHFFAQHYGMTHGEVLERLRARGPRQPARRRRGDLPPRGAHAHLARQGDGRRVPRGAPRRARLGHATNATMLYGHIETFEHRVDHLLRLRALQDESARRGSRRSSRSPSTRTATA